MTDADRSIKAEDFEVARMHSEDSLDLFAEDPTPHEAAVTASSRLLLHAQMLELAHPMTEETLTFKVPCPFI